MNTYLICTQPLLALTIKQFCQNAFATLQFYSFISLDKAIEKTIKNSLIILVENSSEQVSIELLLHLQNNNEIIIIKSLKSYLNTQNLFQSGFTNIMTQNDCESTLKNCISAAKNKSPFLSTEILKELKPNSFVNNKNFSPKEIEIIQLSWQEKANKEIAHNMELSVRTIENYRNKIKEKYGVVSFTGVFKEAIRDGILYV